MAIIHRKLLAGPFRGIEYFVPSYTYYLELLQACFPDPQRWDWDKLACASLLPGE